MRPGNTLVVADGHVLFRQGIVALLRDRPDLQVVAEASNGMEALQRCRALRPDVVLIDAELPYAWSGSHSSSAPGAAIARVGLATHQGQERNGRFANGLASTPEERLPMRPGGIEVTRALREELPETKVVLLTSQTENSDLVYEAIRAGALGFVTKTSEVDELVMAIRTVAKGQASLAMGSLTSLVAILGNQSLGGRDAFDAPEESLSKREEEVLELVARGLGNREIALTLCISESTVRSHLHNILDKLQLSNRVQAATYALTSRKRSSASSYNSDTARKALSATGRASLSQTKAS